MDDPVSVVVPFRNVPALAAYYTGVFSVIPCLGGLLGPIAFGFGIYGLRVARANPKAHGSVHAWVGIIVGGLSSLAHIGIAVLIALGN